MCGYLGGRVTLLSGAGPDTVASYRVSLGGEERVFERMGRAKNLLDVGMDFPFHATSKGLTCFQGEWDVMFPFALSGAELFSLFESVVSPQDFHGVGDVLRGDRLALRSEVSDCERALTEKRERLEDLKGFSEERCMAVGDLRAEVAAAQAQVDALGESVRRVEEMSVRTRALARVGEHEGSLAALGDLGSQALELSALCEDVRVLERSADYAERLACVDGSALTGVSVDVDEGFLADCEMVDGWFARDVVLARREDELAAELAELELEWSALGTCPLCGGVLEDCHERG